MLTPYSFCAYSINTKPATAPLATASSATLLLPQTLPLRIHNQYVPLLAFLFTSNTFCSLASNWLHGGKLLRMHRMPLVPSSRHQPTPHVHGHGDPPGGGGQPSSAIPTSVALDDNWVVVGLANSRIHVFSARTGVLSRTLVGHESGVWAVSLVRGGDPSKGGAYAREEDPMDVDMDEEFGEADHDPRMPPTLRHALGLDLGAEGGAKKARRRSASDVFSEASSRARRAGASRARPNPSAKPSEPSGASDGWGQPHALVVSGGCDKDLRVWDVKSG